MRTTATDSLLTPGVRIPILRLTNGWETAGQHPIVSWPIFLGRHPARLEAVDDKACTVIARRNPVTARPIVSSSSSFDCVRSSRRAFSVSFNNG